MPPPILFIRLRPGPGEGWLFAESTQNRARNVGADRPQWSGKTTLSSAGSTIETTKPASIFGTRSCCWIRPRHERAWRTGPIGYSSGSADAL